MRCRRLDLLAREGNEELDDTLFSLSAYDYSLPDAMIARYPCEPRDHSKLMVIERQKKTINHYYFYLLPNFLCQDDLLIFNNTKVIKARIYGKRQTGGAVEFLLVRPLDHEHWEVMAKPGKKLQIGTLVLFEGGLTACIDEILPNGNRIVKFNLPEILPYLKRYGHLPLPTYMQREMENQDVINYQTVYAKEEGAIAAPTAGLHFTSNLLAQLNEKGVSQTQITLHTGIGTFKPVKEENILNHSMHTERYMINEEASIVLNSHKGRKICVGTTSCRALESACRNNEFTAGEYETDIFIYPGYQFKCTDALLTNFHLPKSTLLMLVCSFGGYDLMMEAYQIAIEKQYRFYSYGDAMLIL